MKEFRVIPEDVFMLNPKSESAADYTDYYLTRERRVRHFKKHPSMAGKWYMIEVEPGTLEKNYEEVEHSDIEETIKSSIIVIEKQGIGHVYVEGTEGYAERVTAYNGNGGRPIIDEVQVEFETGTDILPAIKKMVPLLKVIEKGLFDYVSSAR